MSLLLHGFFQVLCLFMVCVRTGYDNFLFLLCSDLRSLLHDETLEITLLAPAGEQVEKGEPTIRIVGLKEALPFVGPLAVVVSWRAGILVLAHGGLSSYQLHPICFRLDSGLD